MTRCLKLTQLVGSKQVAMRPKFVSSSTHREEDMELKRFVFATSGLLGSTNNQKEALRQLARNGGGLFRDTQAEKQRKLRRPRIVIEQ